MAGGNGTAAVVAPGSCADHELRLDQLHMDARLQSAATRDQDRRLDEHDTAIGGIAAELSGCRLAAERAANEAIATRSDTRTAIDKLAEANTLEHGRIGERVRALETQRPVIASWDQRPMPSISSWDCGPDTSMDVAAGNLQGLVARLADERVLRAAAEAQLAEKNRQSDRAVARRGLRIDGWKAWAGVILAVGSLAAAVGQLLGRWM